MFGVIKFDKIVQVGDKIRLDASQTFAPKGSAAITKVEINPGSGFIDVSGPAPLNSKNWFLDWAFNSAGSKPFVLKITDALSAEHTFNFSLTSLSAVDDNLYSDDNDLLSLESDILGWLPVGKSSFNYLHRKAQAQILDWLEAIRITKQDGSRLEKQDLNLAEDIIELSANWVLMLLFFDLSNKSDDKFYQKHLSYKSKVETIKMRGRIQIDVNGDEQITENERIDFKSFGLIRR